MGIDYRILFSLSCNDDIRLDDIVTPQRRRQFRVATCSSVERNEMGILLMGSVSKVEMATPMDLIYKVLFPSISTFETPPFINRYEFGRLL